MWVSSVAIRVRRVERNYCRDCEWSANIENHDRHELGALAIEHATETGHHVDSDLRGE